MADTPLKNNFCCYHTIVELLSYAGNEEESDDDSEMIWEEGGGQNSLRYAGIPTAANLNVNIDPKNAALIKNKFQ